MVSFRYYGKAEGITHVFVQDITIQNDDTEIILEASNWIEGTDNDKDGFIKGYATGVYTRINNRYKDGSGIGPGFSDLEEAQMVIDTLFYKGVITDILITGEGTGTIHLDKVTIDVTYALEGETIPEFKGAAQLSAHFELSDNRIRGPFKIDN